MKRTTPLTLVVWAVLGAAAGFAVDSILTAGGRPTFTVSVMLPILLILLGAVVIALAVPVARTKRGTSLAPVNPFRALRIAMLAKASSIVGAACAGFGAGLVGFLLTRPVVPSLGSMSAMIATALCGVVLVAAGLIAEQLCTIRKDDDDDEPGGSGPGVAAGGR